MSTLLVIVLAVGVNLGLWVRTTDRRRRETVMWKTITTQQTETFGILSQLDPAVRKRAPVETLHWTGSDSGPGRTWVDSKGLWILERGRRADLIDIRVSGGGRDDASVLPILIEDRGAELNAPYIGRLIRAYRTRKWAYRVVPGKMP